jgi:osmotically-inducible protein OsmY/sporulation protein YlmC with PRC-barrel domain
MAEPKMKMAIASPVAPTTDKWERVKQALLNLHQDKPAKSNYVLTEKVTRALSADHLLGKGDVANMRVTVNRGVATLSGHVVRSSDKAQAEATACEVPGVTGVVNHLVVDAELMIDVAQALGNDQQTANEQIQVNVHHGVVYLGGTVNRAAVRAAAVQVAARIPQVRGIINVIQTSGIVMDIDEERFVQPLVESQIYAIDGQVGCVQQVIINPQNRRVTAVVVHAQIPVPQDLDWTHWPGERLQPPHAILIPIRSIRCASSGALFLTVNGSEAAHFADFNPRSFGPPPTDWQPPYPYWPADVLFARYRSEEENR